MDDRYELVRLIGAGGFGQVWKATDSRVRRMVAIKVITVDGSADPDAQWARLSREATLAGRLSHPNIVTIYDVGSARQDGRLFGYIAMEYLHGRPLNAVLEDGPLDLRSALSIAASVSSALAAAHDRQIVHRDIKPSNIIDGYTRLVDGDEDQTKVVDFGITKTTDRRFDITATGTATGTPAYMAPECFSGDFVPGSDLYALGCVLFEMLTGKKLFDGNTPYQIAHMHQYQAPPRLSEHRRRPLPPDIAADLDPLLDALLTKDFAHRPANAGKIAAQLRGIRDRVPTLKDVVDEFSRLANNWGSRPARPKVAPSQRPTASASEADDAASSRQVRDSAATLAVSAADAASGTTVPIGTTAAEPCPDCAADEGGNGQSPQESCRCGGTGRINRKQTRRIRIPPGVRDGQTLRLPGLGAPAARGAAAGDLYVTVRVEGPRPQPAPVPTAGPPTPEGLDARLLALLAAGPMDIRDLRAALPDVRGSAVSDALTDMERQRRVARVSRGVWKLGTR